MKYPIFLHTDDTLDMASEAIFLHLESVLEEDEDSPKANTITFHKNNPDYDDGIWAIVDVDITPLIGKSETSMSHCRID